METTIKTEVLNKLPPGRYIKTEFCKDMSKQTRKAILWQWYDFTGLRRAHFDCDTGEYLGDCW
jgi:hypothetical protein